MTWALLGGCRLGPPARTITLDDLEAAEPAPMNPITRAVAIDREALRGICTPLGPRLGLVHVHSRRDWEKLARVIPNLGPCPDFRRGSLVGLACWAGTPVDGQWPLKLESVQVSGGGGLLNAKFRGGSYLPDGTAWLETDYVEGLRAVLVVNINGTSFFPTSSD